MIVNHNIQYYYDDYFSYVSTSVHFIAGVLTPTATTVTQSLFGTEGLKTLSEKFLPDFSAWIKKSVKFTYPLNIVTVDFVENRGFILKLIDLNYERISCK